MTPGFSSTVVTGVLEKNCFWQSIGNENLLEVGVRDKGWKETRRVCPDNSFKMFCYKGKERKEM